MQAELYWIEREPPGRLAIMPRPRAGDWLDDELRSLREQGVEVLLTLLTEPELAELELTELPEHCRWAGIDWLHLPIPDRSVPPNGQVTRDILDRLRRDLAEDKGVGIQCRAGIGRSATIAAVLPVGSGMSVDMAFERVATARGCPVPDTDEQRVWVELRSAEVRDDRD